MSHHKMHSLQIHTDGMGSAVNLPLISGGLQAEHTMLRDITAQNVGPTHVANAGQQFTDTLETFELKDALDAVGPQGLCIKSATNPGVKAFMAKHDACDDLASGSVHRSFRYQNGLLVPDQLTVQHQGNARLRLRVHPIGDGTNASYVVSDTEALPTITITPARWTAGPIKLGGIALDGYRQVTVNFGNQIQSGAKNSDVEDTFVENREVTPDVIIEGIDASWFAASGAIPIGGKQVVQATDYIYLRKRSQDQSAFVADGTAEHIKLTMFGLALGEQLYRAEARRVSTHTLHVYLAVDSAGNAPLVASTDVAITT